jgi:hypothetical protein
MGACRRAVRLRVSERSRGLVGLADLGGVCLDRLLHGQGRIAGPYGTCIWGLQKHQWRLSS